MATIFKLPRVKHVDSTGTPFAGAKLEFFLTGTSTNTDTYSDAALTTPNANPVVADSAGLFGIIYLDPSITYKSTLSDTADVVLYTEDPVSESVNVIGNTIITKTTTYTTVAGDDGKVIECTGTFTITLLAAATAGAGFTQIITNVGTGTITVDGNASETINGYTTLVLGVNESIFIACDGSNWAGTFSTNQHNSVEAITGAETVAIGDRGRVYNVTSGTFSVTLLAAATAGEGFVFTVVNQGTGVVTLDGNSAETINGQTTLALGPSTGGTSATIICDGTNWVATIVTLASATLEGIVELATKAELIAGTDTTRAIVPNDLHDTLLIFQSDDAEARTGGTTGTAGWTIARTATGKHTITHGLGLADVEDGLLIVPAFIGDVTGDLNAVVLIRATNSFDIWTFTAGTLDDLGAGENICCFCWLNE